MVRLCSIRSFSGSSIVLSNIGKKPVRLLDGVSYSVEQIPIEFCKKFQNKSDTYELNRQLILEGPLGKVKQEIAPFIRITKDEKENQLLIGVQKPNNKLQKSLWGTTRAILQRNLIGITEGHLSIVKFVGTGFRAIIEKDTTKNKEFISLKLGFPFTPRLEVPKGIKVSTPNPTRLIIEGNDYEKVKQFAASIRLWKKPEPYKGKGIFIDDETIKLKERKIK
ncbi:unnamed protein product [Candida verbasci]|uniref:Large ribosomal subunit protein uL6 alpha-beta domain-containing protein n=1 Tax=Candida verbasci TaxID=1227364 RepID=A0A9W4X853_9ASCO|nr:unnamed protein product [Candida verbasci]